MSLEPDKKRERAHGYAIQVAWTGNTGTGTASYKGYERSFEVSASGKQRILGSADASFRGDAARWNPEESLLSALASCHMLAYLHLCASNGITVTAYSDSAKGTMVERAGGGAFTSVVLQPDVKISDTARIPQAVQLHHQAHEACFIANSVNFPVTCEPQVHV